MGAQLACQFQIPNAKLESNCQSLIHKIGNPEVVRNEIGILCISIRRALKQTGDGRWQHTPREANGAAHVTAHAEGIGEDRVIWLDTPPSFLINQLQLDNVTASSD
ncbi:unnamed protein product [Linum trigynum]|uniref:RNase H type-1 domain-containing protein n=1 Tax=Linum trigynum TaxID=586398 RepID=A0AAV2CUA0_9ROSI